MSWITEYLSQFLAFPQGFRILAKQPIDSRFVRSTVEEMEQLPIAEKYIGLPVYVQQEDKLYLLKASGQFEELPDLDSVIRLVESSGINADDLGEGLALVNGKLTAIPIADMLLESSQNPSIEAGIRNYGHRVELVCKDSSNQTYAATLVDTSYIHTSLSQGNYQASERLTKSYAYLLLKNASQKAYINTTASGRTYEFQSGSPLSKKALLEIYAHQIGYTKYNGQDFRGFILRGFGETNDQGDGADYSGLKGISFAPIKLVKDMMGELVETLVDELVTDGTADTKKTTIKQSLGL